MTLTICYVICRNQENQYFGKQRRGEPRDEESQIVLSVYITIDKSQLQSTPEDSKKQTAEKLIIIYLDKFNKTNSRVFLKIFQYFSYLDESFKYCKK